MASNLISARVRINGGLLLVSCSYTSRDDSGFWPAGLVMAAIGRESERDERGLEKQRAAKVSDLRILISVGGALEPGPGVTYYHNRRTAANFSPNRPTSQGSRTDGRTFATSCGQRSCQGIYSCLERWSPLSPMIAMAKAREGNTRFHATNDD